MMSAAQELYSIDTSALIDGLERYYPSDAFPALWDRVDELIASGRLFFSEEVWEEIKVRDAVVKAWCESRKDSLIVATDGMVAQHVQSLLVNHPRLVMNMKGRNRADPFVIAVAQIRGGLVVTGEGGGGTQQRPKIPFVCQQLNVRCIRFLDLIRIEGWTF
jgi:hypothetical protein